MNNSFSSRLRRAISSGSSASKSLSSSQSGQGAHQIAELQLDSLEPRVLFSAAPVETPTEVDAGETVQAQSGESIQQGQAGDSTGLTQESLEVIANAAKQRWIDSGISAAQLDTLNSVTYQISDLGGNKLGRADGTIITIDDDAAATGSWFIDATPDLDEEFSTLEGSDRLTVVGGSSAAGSYDLLSVMLHEQGHVLGLGDSSEAWTVMNPHFSPSVRSLPTADAATTATALPGSLGPEYATGGVSGTEVTINYAAGFDFATLEVNGSGNLLVNGADQGIAVNAITKLTADGNGTGDYLWFAGDHSFDFTSASSIELGTTTAFGIISINQAISGNQTDFTAFTNELYLNNNGTTLFGSLATGGGDISLTADADGDGSGSASLEGPIDAGGGDLTIQGAIIGVSSTISTSGSGNITLSSAPSSGEGVRLNDNSQVTTSGSGAIDIIGTSITGNGIRLASSAQVTTNGGNISLTGSSASIHGILLEGDQTNGAQIKVTSGVGNISLHGTSQSVAHPLYSGVQSWQGGAEISTFSGNIDITGSHSGNGSGIVLLDTVIEVTDGAGDIAISGTGDNYGVFSNSLGSGSIGTQITSQGGDISIQGEGNANRGVWLRSAPGKDLVVKTTGGDGNISIEGTGTLGVSFDATVKTDISTESGDIMIRGNGSEGHGIYFLGLTEIASTDGAGNIRLEGTGASNGVYASANARVTTAGGDIDVLGSSSTAGGAGFPNGDGVQFAQQAYLQTTAPVGASTPGTGKITIQGTGAQVFPHASTFGAGVRFQNKTDILTEAGDISISGSGTGFGVDGFASNQGFTAKATAGPGNISIIGTGDSPDYVNTRGVNITAPDISSQGGNIFLKGTSNGGYGFTAFGSGPGVSTNGAGQITIEGTGGNGNFGPRQGVAFYSTISTAGGDVSITGESKPDSQGEIADGVAVTLVDAGGGDISLTANRGINIGSQVASLNGHLSITPLTDGTDINFGDVASSPDDLLIDSFDLNAISAGDGFAGITIGSETSGDIFLASVGFRDPTTLISGGRIDSTARMDFYMFGNPLTTYGTLSAGSDSSALIRANGDLTLGDNSGFEVEIGGTTPEAEHDQIITFNSSRVDIGAGVTLDVSQLNGFTPELGDTFVIIQRTGGSGEFAGFGEGAQLNNFLNSGLNATISYQGGDGDDVVLTVVNPLPNEVSIDAAGNAMVATNGGQNTINISTDGNGNLVINTPGDTLAAGSGASGAGGNVLIPLASLNSLGINGGDGDDEVSIADLTGFTGALNIDGGDGQDAITFKADVTLDADNEASVTAEEVDFVNASLTTQGSGSISIDSSGASGGSSHQVGIDLLGSDLRADGTGSIALTGEGAAGGSNNQGIQLTNGSSVSTNDGDINLVGTGGSGTSANHGIYLHSGSSVSAGGSGNLNIDGTGGDGSSSNHGVYFSPNSSASVEDGNMTIDGTGGNGTSLFNRGVEISSATLTSTGLGNIFVFGTGNGSSAQNPGVLLQSSTVSISGSGGITLNGTGALNGTSYNQGVKISASAVSTISGNIDINGNGNGSTTQNSGVAISNSSVTTSGTAAISISGIGGNGTSYNVGLVFGSSSTISTSSGNLTLSGSGRGNLTGNRGIEIASGTSIQSTGSGSVALLGSGSSTATGMFNSGVYASNGTVQANSGNLSITGNGGSGSSYNAGVRLIGGTYQSATGTLDIDGGANAGTTGTRNYGVWVQGAAVGGGGGSAIDGTGGGGTGYNHGVYMLNVTGAVAPGDVAGSITDGIATSEEESGNFFP